MPLKHDTNPHYEGKKYCSYCYQDGKFTQENITLKEMQSLVVKQLVKFKVPKFMAKLMVFKIAKLERWKNKENS